MARKSSQHALPKSSSGSDTTGKIKHICRLSKDFTELHNSEDYSDLTLIVAGQKFHAHKNVLAARSQFFRALLFGGLKESSQREIELKDVDPAAFKGRLNYMYTGRILLADKPEEVVFHILGLADLYGFLELQDSTIDYLRKILNIDNAWSIYEVALLYRLEFLTCFCLEFMDAHAIDILEHESFLQQSCGAVSKLISRNTFYASEIQIFLAVQSWVKANPESDKDSVLSKVTLNLMTYEELLHIVRPTNLFTSEAILDAMEDIICETHEILQYRESVVVKDVSEPDHCSDITGNIEHICRLSEDFAQLHKFEDYSDLTLIVAGQKFHAHKIVLATRTQYFRALLFDGLKESCQREVELKDASPAAFKDILKYMYTGTLSVADKTEEVQFHIIGLAHLYDFFELENSILDYLCRILSIHNISSIYDAALLYRQEYLTDVCLEFMDNDAIAILQHESFLQLSNAAVIKLISRDSFAAPEIDVFVAVHSWVKANPESDKDNVLSKMKLNLMMVEELLDIVRPTEMFSSEAILDAIATKISDGDVVLQYRQDEENVVEEENNIDLNSSDD